MLLRHVSLVGAALLAAACLTNEGAEDTTSTGGNGGGNTGAGGDAGAPIEGQEEGSPELVSDPAAGGGVGIQPAACELDPTGFLLAGEQSLALAPGQYFESILAATGAPPKSSSRAAIETFLQNRPELAAALPSVSFTASDQKGLYVVHSAARIAPLPAEESALHVVVLVDVSPSNATVEPTRDRVLDALADGVDADGKAKFSLVAFSQTASILLDRVASGSAKSTLDTVRTELAVSEGENLSEALKLTNTLLDVGDATHVVVLTDAGFLPAEDARAQASVLGTARTRVSVAQLSNVAGATSEALPELRVGLLNGIAIPGRGLSLFIDETREVEFENWFARPIPSDGLAGFQLALPPGLILVEKDDISGNDISTLPVINPRMAITLTESVADECNLETQAGTSAGLLRVGVSENFGEVEIVSPQGEGIVAKPDQDDEIVAAALARLDAVIDGATCSEVVMFEVAACEDGVVLTHDCAYAATIHRMIDDACAGAP